MHRTEPGLVLPHVLILSPTVIPAQTGIQCVKAWISRLRLREGRTLGGNDEPEHQELIRQWSYVRESLCIVE